ncbi:hypothetical protein [Romboutsia lituseburensis]|uniref:hypothetical protein n=1 Tax=Romboutsia lituseburensis TaxID=1537 RepID=UPI00215AA5A0|nr:hypothetical protein [Romboutsia lituseburensis]MCR8746232.1 hypothetical protein [Romboutsia lituseburensis]
MIFGVLVIILATIIFFLINSILDITYFGCGAIGTMLFGCFIASYAILGCLGGIVLGLLKWIVIGGVIIFIIGLIASKNDKL